jgi:broad specificity phosphatase PhoE
MITYYLVRHGQKQNIPFDPPLSDMGQKQAQAAAEYLKDIPFLAIYASPKLRTCQTAAIIAKPHRLAIQTDET